MQNTGLSQQWEQPVGNHQHTCSSALGNDSVQSRSSCEEQQEQRSCPGEAPCHGQGVHHCAPRAVAEVPRAPPQAQRSAPREPQCLQLLSRCLLGVGLSSYTLKTVLMHLLSTVPLTRWRRRDFPQRMMDILKHLRCSLETKALQHFVIGNERLPVEIRLPSDLRLAEPPNLFQHLASDPDAHAKALQDYFGLVLGLRQLLPSGH